MGWWRRRLGEQRARGRNDASDQDDQRCGFHVDYLQTDDTDPRRAKSSIGGKDAVRVQ
jgi:hypothetical protein